MIDDLLLAGRWILHVANTHFQTTLASCGEGEQSVEFDGVDRLWLLATNVSIFSRGSTPRNFLRFPMLEVDVD